MSYTVRNAKRAMSHFANTPRWQVSRDTERGPVFCTLPTVPGQIGFSTLEVLRRYCEINRSGELDFAAEYGEPGYSNPEKGILFANWNDMPKALLNRLEAQGYELEWSDEWTVDYSSNKAYRTSPDSYGWQPQIQHTEDGDLLTPDSDISEWIDWAKCESAADATRALPGRYADELGAHGWARVDANYETGFHPGQTDNPRDLARELLKTHRAVLFVIDDAGQFDVHWSAYVETTEE